MILMQYFFIGQQEVGLLLSKKNKNTILVISCIIVLLIPAGVNFLMSFKVVKVYGDTSAWIGFLGSYIGSVVTLLGVLLTIRFTKNQARKDMLPEKIANVEECLDFIENILDKIEGLEGRDIEETLYKNSYERRYFLFDINYNYQLEKKEVLDNIIKNHPKKIRNYAVKSDTEAYRSYNKFVDNLETIYMQHIGEIDDRLRGFEGLVIDRYTDTHDMIIYSNDGRLNDIELDEEDLEKIRDIRSSLYYKEIDYTYALKETYESLREDFQRILEKLAKEFND